MGDLETLLALLQAGQLSGIVKAAATLSTLAPLLADRETAEALEKAVKLLREAEERGVLDKAQRVLEKAAPLLDALENLDYEALAGALRTSEEGEAGLRELLRALRDPRFRRGLARLIAFLEALGSVPGNGE